jgi:hypothetical protein
MWMEKHASQVIQVKFRVLFATALAALVLIVPFLLDELKRSRIMRDHFRCREGLELVYLELNDAIRLNKSLLDTNSSDLLERLLAEAYCSKKSGGYVALDIELSDLVANMRRSSKPFLIAMDAEGNHKLAEGKEKIQMLWSNGIVLETVFHSGEAGALRQKLKSGLLVDATGQIVTVNLEFH